MSAACTEGRWLVQQVINTETDFPGAGEETTGDGNMPWLPAGHFAPDGAYMAWVEADLKVGA